jgi:hypothetical protein
VEAGISRTESVFGVDVMSAPGIPDANATRLLSLLIGGRAMAMIFPGMDPYIENPQIFPGIHGPMVVYLRDQLAPLIRPRYVASTGERVYVEGPVERPIVPDAWVRRTQPEDGGVAVLDTAVVDEPTVIEVPDMEIHEPYIEILDRESRMRVVTVIELVSPTNKYAGPGRVAYVTKQQEVRYSTTHLVEIDLLRYGPHVLAVSEAQVRGRFAYDYLISVNRAAEPRCRFEVYPRTVRQPLPRIRVPLAGDDPDVKLDIRATLEQAYEAGSYGERIDYHTPCEPPLERDDQAWADGLIASLKG